MAAGPASLGPVSDNDEYQWLENLDDPAATAWVMARNEETKAALTGSDRFAELRAQAREVLDSVEGLPYPTWRDGYLMATWRRFRHSTKPTWIQSTVTYTTR